MLDIKFIRENKEIVAAGAKKKHISVDLDALLALDEKRLMLTKAVDELRAKQNEANTAIVNASGERREELLNSMRTVKDALVDQEEELKKVMVEWRALMLLVPNVPDMSVPDGASDADNAEYSRSGDPKKFSFTPKSHIELLSALDCVDFERGTKIAGFRGYVLKREAALLELALWRYATDALITKGFTPLRVPALVRKETLLGTGYLPQGEEDLYHTQDGEYLAGTAEVATMGYYQDELISAESLPIALSAFSVCYRREAGSHGKDTQGLMRLHEFYKVEQVVLCEANHNESVRWHEALRENAEEIMQGLEIPYRVVINCGADLGLGQVKKYDIEAWVPSEEQYRETHSISYFHDFQTRRCNIRYTDPDGTKRFAHSLNGTALATPRTLIAFVENHQQEDGSIAIPKALQPYTNFERIARS